MPEQLPVTEEPLGLRVSAVLVAFNQASELRRSIEALEKSQERERLEILVVDCGSRDESPQVDAEYPAIQMLRLPHHFGATKAMNIATRTAKSDLLFFLSPGVEVLPDTVSRLAGLLEEDAAATAVCPLLVDGEGKPASRVSRIPTRQVFASGELPALDLDLSQDLIAVEYPDFGAILIRKQFIRGINYFDERFGQYWADADLAMQIRRGGKKILLYPGIQAVRQASSDPVAGDPLSAADKLLGAAAFLGKHHGFFSGLGFRLAVILKALGRGDLRQAGFLLSGQKLDGSQTA